MAKFLLRLALCTAALAAVTTTVANAADYEPPPPPEESWTGPYIGAFVMGVGVESPMRRNATIRTNAPSTGDERHHLGRRPAGRLQLRIWRRFPPGVEGDYGWAGGIDNDDPVEAAEMNIEDIATLRVRAGFLSEETLFYATGGVAWVKTTVGGEVGDPSDPNRPFNDDTARLISTSRICTWSAQA